jgi:hypothetical protein
MDGAINPSIRDMATCDPATVGCASVGVRPFIFTPPLHPTPLVFACPHSGRYYPYDLDANVDLFSLGRLEDTDVDLLLKEAPNYGAAVIAVSVRARGVISGVGDGGFWGGACPTPKFGGSGGHRAHRYGGVD